MFLGNYGIYPAIPLDNLLVNFSPFPGCCCVDPLSSVRVLCEKKYCTSLKVVSYSTSKKLFQLKKIPYISCMLEFYVRVFFGRYGV